MRRKLDQINQRFPTCAGSSTLLSLFYLVALDFCRATRAVSTQYRGGPLLWFLERRRPKRPK
jgi:hypothetical protein